MELTATGTAINFAQGIEQPFSLQFNLAGGTLQSAGCDSALMGATISDFSAVIGGQAFAAPTSFLGNLTTSPYPTCAGPTEVQITSAKDSSLDIQYWQTSNPAQHSTFTGNVGGWYIASGSYQVSNTVTAPELSVPEPSTLALFACAFAILLAHRARSRRATMTA